MTKADIRRTESLFGHDPALSSWLSQVLQIQNLEPACGILARMSEVLEQEGNLVTGIWLTCDTGFWEFEALISRMNGALINLERFENVTSSIPL